MIHRLPQTLSPNGTPAGEIDHPEVLRRFEVTIEREFVAVRKPADEEFLSFCPGCGHDVVMISPERVAGALGIGVRSVYRWMEEKKVNFVEPGEGKIFVCFESAHKAADFRKISSGESR